jgi:YHS domain-containing protein
MAEHDAKPKKGQRVCPITDTVANPKLSWVVGGKTYQFCCPPCVTEFVKKAKTNPKAIKAPEDYVKK